ncbi:type VII secretion-associated serine protease mycosin [Micromonospora sp. DT233]|uniref:type VII secretion-associated serine protease mycosin n=1 Tax=Micromonospora sp. DT233 TaxID=3393432 RepID=UPI003CEA4039
MTGVRQARPTTARRCAGRALLGVATLAVSLVGPVAPSAVAAAPARPTGAVPLAAPAVGGLPWRVTPARADQIRGQQWQLDELRAEAVWRTSTGRGVTVAVIDSGVDAAHPDLAGQVLDGIDMVADDGTDDGPDPVGHGTTVAALIAGRNDDRRGAVGLAPDAKILPVRVLDDENRYDDALVVARAVRWAVDKGARVINLSLGSGGDSPALAAALDYAFARDVVVVACTGNVATSTDTRVWYPAREPGVIAVAGLERSGDALWSGSITGPATVLTAPATGLVGARPGGYWRVQGTSFASPLVAATAALVRSHWPQLSAGEVVNRLISTARDVGPAGRDDRFGYGVVDPLAALTADVPPVGRNPLDDHTSPGVVGFGPAPGSGQDDPVAGAGADPLGFTTRQQARWAARPAGGGVDSVAGRLWAGGGVLAVGAVGVALTLRRRHRRSTR